MNLSNKPTHDIFGRQIDWNSCFIRSAWSCGGKVEHKVVFNGQLEIPMFEVHFNEWPTIENNIRTALDGLLE